MFRAPSQLPTLDCHAHIAPDVTEEQLEGLHGAQIFAVTRSLGEAETAGLDRGGLVWGVGAHPGKTEALAEYSPDAFDRLLERRVLVGEVGLDRRSGHLELQRNVFGQMMQAVTGKPVLVSIHSAGATALVMELLQAHRHPGVLLHWFMGSDAEMATAVELGCYFSVNAAMPREAISRLPQDRVLTETDFPASRRKTKAMVPGDTRAIEGALAETWDAHHEDVRRQVYRNLRDVSLASGAIERLPDQLADLLLAA